MKNCLYYQANVRRSDCWFFVAILRSFEHLVFDRTLDKKTGLFEFFVSPNGETTFQELICYFEKLGTISNVQKLPNRFSQSDS